MPVKFEGGGGLNTKDLSPQVTNLYCNGTNARIDVSFTGVAAGYLHLVRFYRVVAKAGSMPQKPTDGVYVGVASGAGGATLGAALTGLTNDVTYYVRVYVRCQSGWQTSADAWTVCTPRAGISISTLPVGAMVRLNVGGVPRNFLVVHQGLPSAIYDGSCNGSWLLSKDILENRQWNVSNDNRYASSTIHSYLNSTLLTRFDANIQNVIKQVKIPYGAGFSTNAVYSGTNGLSVKVFLPSCYELGLTSNDHPYFPADGSRLSYFLDGRDQAAKAKRVAYLDGNAVDWWPRSPSDNASTHAWVLYCDGVNSTYACSTSCGMRPALILPFDFRLSPVPNADGSYNPT